MIRVLCDWIVCLRLTACVCVICWQCFGIYLLCPPFVVLLLLSAVHVVSSFLAGVFSQSKSEREGGGRERERGRVDALNCLWLF